MSAHKAPWRENVEALTMAVVVALLFKYFVLEISKIPSGSMQPTLMGNPETGTFDRTLVDKLSYRFRDPERFEIVVFKHPLERSRIMVKRLCGMPGEEFKVEFGDLWTRATDGAEWRVLRRPPSVQRGAWRTLAPSPRGPDWALVRGGKDWRITGSGAETHIEARGEGAVRFRSGTGPVMDGYLDGYPRSIAGKIAQRDPSWGENPVGDVRLEGELTALADTRALVFELTEGQRAYEFRVPGPAAEAEAEILVRIRDSATSSERVERGARQRLTAGARVAFALENLDDRLAFELEGETVLAAEIPASARQEASLTLSVEGAGEAFGVDLDGLSVARDVYYLPPPGRGSWSVRIPPGQYVMLGDNTQDSADSRLWESITFGYRPEGGGEPVLASGNHRRGENPFPDGSVVRLRDVWGEVHWFGSEAVTGRSFPGNAPLVPRELILGRALAVFWPIRPLDGLWRVGWLH